MVVLIEARGYLRLLLAGDGSRALKAEDKGDAPQGRWVDGYSGENLRIEVGGKSQLRIFGNTAPTKEV